jgi:hypothetical protein
MIRRQIEAEAVDHLPEPRNAASALRTSVLYFRAVTGKCVATTGVIDRASGIIAFLAVVSGVAETSEGQGWAMIVALAGVIVDHVENDADSGLVKRLDRETQIGNAARCEPRVGRQHGDRDCSPRHC